MHPAASPPTLAPTLGLLLAALAAPLASAETERRGCGLNPPGSLTVEAGSGVLGRALVLGIDNPLGTQTPGSATYLLASLAPDGAAPCGTFAFGLSMAGYGTPGELTVSLDDALFLGVWAGGAWEGPGSPSSVLLVPPDDPSLVGTRLDLQGLVIDGSGNGAVVVGATEGLRVTLEAACDANAPCFEAMDIGARVVDVRVSGALVENGPIASEHTCAQELSALTTFARDAAVELPSSEGGALASSAAEHASVVGARRIAASLEVAAHASGALFDRESRARSELWLEFEIQTRARASYTVDAFAESGLSQAVAVVLADGSQQFNTTVSDGEFESDAWNGWLEPESYTLIASNIAQVQSTGSSTTGALELELRLLHAADADFDGDVDADDLTAFALAFALASPTVDMDGDGDVDAADQDAFDAAYAAALAD